MLDGDHRRAELTAAQWIWSLPCDLHLPDQLSEEFEQTGLSTPRAGDLRRHARMHCRGRKFRAALESCQSLPGLPRVAGWHGVYTTDLSHNGCGFLHSAVLFPNEQMRLVMLTGKTLFLEIARCRRVAERCYSIGANFVSPFAADVELAEFFGKAASKACQQPG